MTKVNDEYILMNFGHVTQRDMAAYFGVSVSTINRHCKRLGLSEDAVAPARPNNPSEQGSEVKRDHLSQLYWLRDILFEQICSTRGHQVAKLSKEYRETLTEIRLLEGGEDEPDQDVFAEIIQEFASQENRVSGTDV